MAEKKFTKLISWLFLLYFLILAGERVQSLVRTISQNGMFSSLFDDFVNLTAILSLCSAVVILLVFNAGFWKSLFTSFEPDYSALTIASGVILVSGMVHTQFTISPLQFAAYGMLIAAMILRTLELSGDAESRFVLWYSLGYVTAFSMAIPVVYHSEISGARWFHLVEAIVMLALVASFTIMLRRLFIGFEEDQLMWVPLILMAVGDTAVLWMRWEEEINFFVLIFAALSAVMFAVGKLLFLKKK